MIYMFLADGFEEVEALCPLDILRRAGLEVTTVGIGNDVIQGAHGIIVHADTVDLMYRDPSPEMIILPGGMPGSDNLDKSRIVDSAVRTGAKKGAYLCAICAAPLVLGKRGILEGKRAVCFPGFEEYLVGATISESDTVVRDGNVITAKGMGVADRFGLALVSALYGEECAQELFKTTMMQ